jgi:serine/threonine protein kinase
MSLIPTTIYKKIGEGTDGIVFSAQQENKSCAIKIFKHRNNNYNEDEWNIAQIINKIKFNNWFKASFIPLRIQQRLSDPLFSYILPVNKLNVRCVNNMSKIDLNMIVDANNGDCVYQMKRINSSLYEFIITKSCQHDFNIICLTLIRALIFQINNLHKNNIIHGDIKIENIGVTVRKKKPLVDKQNNKLKHATIAASTKNMVKITQSRQTSITSRSLNISDFNNRIKGYLPNIMDFGYAFKYEEGKQTTEEMNRGSWVYCPYESFIINKTVDLDLFRSKDIHGLGIVIYTLLTRSTPYDKNITESEAKKILESDEFYINFQQKIIEANESQNVLTQTELSFILNFVNRSHLVRCKAFDDFIEQYRLTELHD